MYSTRTSSWMAINRTVCNYINYFIAFINLIVMIYLYDLNN